MRTFYFRPFIAALFSLCSISSYADAWTHYSGNCNWFSKRYKVHVDIKKQGSLFNYCGKTEADCYHAEAECRYPEVTAEPFNFTYARAYALRNDSQNIVEVYGGYDGSHQWIAGANVLMQVPRFSTHPMIERMIGRSRRYGTAKAQIGRIEFDYKHHVIHLYDISSAIEVNSFDKANDFAAMVLSVTKILTDSSGNEIEPSDKEYTQSLVWDTRCLLNNGRLLLKGGLKSGHVASKSEEDKSTVTIFANHIAIPIDPKLDMENLQVNIGVDNGNLGMGISERFEISGNAEETVQLAEETEMVETLNFYNYPNPVVGKSTEVYFEINTNEQVQLLLCDENGLPVETIFSGIAEKKQKLQFTVNLSKIRRLGYLKLILPEKVLVRKILIAP